MDQKVSQHGFHFLRLFLADLAGAAGWLVARLQCMWGGMAVQRGARKEYSWPLSWPGTVFAGFSEFLGVQSKCQSNFNYGSENIRLEMEFGSKVIKNQCF